MSISLSPLLLIVTLAVVLPMLVVGGVAIAAVKRKDWLGLAVLAFTAIALLLGGSLALWSTALRVERDFGGMPHVVSLTDSAVGWNSTAPIAPTPPDPTTTSVAEVATDEELAAIASAAPQIDLDDEVAKDEMAPAQQSERPSWANGDVGPNQKLIVSGPFTAQDSCEIDAEKQLSKWLYDRLGYSETKDAAFSSIGLDLPQVIKSQHYELRDTSVGEMHFLYTLAEVTPEYEQQIAESLAKRAAEVTRTRGARAVTLTGAGLLSLVAVTHVVLRSGGRRGNQ